MASYFTHLIRKNLPRLLEELQRPNIISRIRLETELERFGVLVFPKGILTETMRKNGYEIHTGHKGNSDRARSYIRKDT